MRRSDIATRIYEIAKGSKAAGKTALAIDKVLSDASVEAIYREGKAVELTDTTIIQVGDSVAITGTMHVLEIRFRLLRPGDNRRRTVCCWFRKTAKSS